MNNNVNFKRNSNGAVGYLKSFLLFLTGLIGLFSVLYTDNLTVHAKGADSNLTQSTAYINSGSTILHDESSGVTELDTASNKVNKIIKWAVTWIGAIIALVGLVAAIIMASSHQTEQRNQALIAMVMGLIIAFSPQIIEYVTGFEF